MISKLLIATWNWSNLSRSAQNCSELTNSDQIWSDLVGECKVLVIQTVIFTDFGVMSLFDSCGGRVTIGCELRAVFCSDMLEDNVWECTMREESLEDDDEGEMGGLECMHSEWGGEHGGERLWWEEVYESAGGLSKFKEGGYSGDSGSGTWLGVLEWEGGVICGRWIFFGW